VAAAGALLLSLPLLLQTPADLTAAKGDGVDGEANGQTCW
jgi:hypothetical protein